MKRGRGSIMIPDDIVAHDTHEKIKRSAMGRQCKRNWMPRTCFRAKDQ